jgi:hypothetical protein
MSFFKEESDDELAPDQKDALYQSLKAKYAAAADDQGVKDAESSASRTNIASLIGQAVAGYGANKARARGVNINDNSAIFQSMRDGAKQDVASARQGRKDKMDSVLTADEIERKDLTRGREDEDYSRSNDPESPESKNAQALAQKLMPQGDFTGMSARQLKASLPSLEKIYAAEQQRLGREDTIKAQAEARRESALNRASSAEQARLAREAAKDEDRRWKEEQVTKANDEKKKTTLREVEDRRQNINDALSTVEKMIDEDGTYELLGSHNKDMDRLIDQIATDMAKLQDPDSVARPAEVDLIKRGLVESGAWQQNSTAKDALANFRKEVDRRAKTAYSVRAIDAPGQKVDNIAGGGASGQWGEANAAPAGKPKTVIQNGHTYTLNEKTGEYE